MNKILYIIIASVALASCHSGHSYIHGKINADDLRESVYIYYVPLEETTLNCTDSTLITNGKFSFEIKEETIGVIRVDFRRRFGLQDLLVISEPGNVEVTIGAVSNSRGTFQNDSLQAWKELVEAHSREMKMLYEAGLKERADSSHKAFKARTIQLAHNVGDNTTLGKFLLKLYPEQ